MISLTPKLVSLAVQFGTACDPNDPSYNGSHPFFGFVHWWKYIHKGSVDALGNCTPSVEFPKGALAIGLAAIDMLLYLAGIIAVVSIIIAGISMITSVGNTEQTVAARRRIYNALIGLAIAVIAITAVSFIGNSL